ncbi:MAG: LytTR family DNA-binding domain-containing protein [Bacteroidia bacterium]
MNKIRAVIVDDEQSGRDSLRRLLEENCRDVEVVDQAGSVDQAVEVIRLHNPDLVFLDVEMPRGSGFELLKRIDRPSFKTIFVTAHNHYAIKAIKFSAADYLLKPVDVDELIASVDHVKTMHSDWPSRYSNISDALDPGKKSKLAVPVKDGFVFISPDEIIRLQADGSYTHIYTANEKYTASRNIKEYEDLLHDRGFFRAHHSHLINLSHVRNFSRNEGYSVAMSDGSVVEVARRKKDQFLQLMNA